MPKKDEKEKTSRGEALPFDDTVKLTPGETIVIEATGTGASEEQPEEPGEEKPVEPGEETPKPASFTVEKNADGFYVIKGVTSSAYYSDEATAKRVAEALTLAATTQAS